MGNAKNQAWSFPHVGEVLNEYNITRLAIDCNLPNYWVKHYEVVLNYRLNKYMSTFLRQPFHFYIGKSFLMLLRLLFSNIGIHAQYLP